MSGIKQCKNRNKNSTHDVASNKEILRIDLLHLGYKSLWSWWQIQIELLIQFYCDAFITENITIR
jgi:hypothetical protein